METISNTVHAYMEISHQFHNDITCTTTSQKMFSVATFVISETCNYCNLRNDIYCAVQSHDVNLATMQKLQGYWFGDNSIFNTVHAYVGISHQFHNDITCTTIYLLCRAVS